MTDIILRIYNFMKHHRMGCLFSLVGLTLLLVLAVSRLGYKEDIADFLPMDSEHHNALKVYQDISGANKLFAIFQYKDTTQTSPDEVVAAIDAFVANVQEADTAHTIRHMMWQVDLEKMSQLSEFVYTHIPYFLSEADYARMDSLLASPGYVPAQLANDKQMLLFPSGGFWVDNIGRDPLNLFTPVVQGLQRANSGLKYEMYDGYIFSPDMQKAIVMIDSPYGASETENNATLTAMLRASADSATASLPNIEAHIIGGPVIAVTNAQQIKSDSIFSVSIAVVLILTLLLVSFRNVRNLLLIGLSIAWGWLFAMGGLALFHDKVSVIVIGISSVILGIAVNYPLHFIAHLSHTPDKRKALREIVMPLLVGNITTVGAFLALVPLQSVALRDLGLFSSFLLIGTIFFVLVYLPHLSRETKEVKHSLLDRVSNVSLENSRWLVAVVLVLTVVLGYFSFQTRFDANMGHINYMTDEQRADMAYFQRMMTPGGEFQKVYAISSGATLDAALDQNLRLQPQLDSLSQQGMVHSSQSCHQFVASKAEQQRRLARWTAFVQRHGDKIKSELRQNMGKEGFANHSFDDFLAILDGSYQPCEVAAFEPLIQSAFASNISVDSIEGRYNVVDVLSVRPADAQKVQDHLRRQGCYSFDVVSMNSAIANHLSDDFNYIGFACGFIVFFFLWLSLGSLELALLSFVPMAVSWLWILGIMALFDMQFNIVNIILATFIFGQGDDYTIFMTEGAMYEYAYRRKMLASYKHSIIISALIMFIGIGTLIVARHPALHSLAEVTIAGMFSVVLMAYIFPPLIFKCLVRYGGRYRRRPLSIKRFSVMALSAGVFFSQLLVVHVVGFVLFCLMPFSEKRRQWYRRFQQRLFLFDFHHIPGVTFRCIHVDEQTFAHPSIIVCNHQSMLDSAIFMALSPKVLLISNQRVRKNWLIKQVYKWNGFITLGSGDMVEKEQVRQYVTLGYSVVLFPEGERNDGSSIGRFHKGAFYLAEELGLDIVPIMLHGVNQVLPRNSVQVYPGIISVMAFDPIKRGGDEGQLGYSELTRKVGAFYKDEYQRYAQSVETADYYQALVLDRYRYKGTEIFHAVKKRLERSGNYRQWIDCATDGGKVLVVNGGYGEMALLYALVHKQTQVMVVEPDAEKAALLTHCAEDVVTNLQVLPQVDVSQMDAATPIYILDSMAVPEYARYNPIIIL